MQLNVRFPTTLLAMELCKHSPAAFKRVPSVKHEEVEEVFFGNVLSAKFVASTCHNRPYADALFPVSAKILRDNAPSMLACPTPPSARLLIKSAPPR